MSGSRASDIWKYRIKQSGTTKHITVFGCPRKDKLINHLRAKHGINDDDIAHTIANTELQPPIKFCVRPTGNQVPPSTAGSAFIYSDGELEMGYYLIEKTEETLQPEELSADILSYPLPEDRSVFDFGETGIRVTATDPELLKQNEFFYPDIEIDPLAHLRAIQRGLNYVPHE
ncbi:MAG: hypothetical protein M1813_004294 [Trichoglossum hirsutum]|nr:MAG: hypothetical protein M1813_004294 [Trichoglossum hirsutum]